MFGKKYLANDAKKKFYDRFLPFRSYSNNLIPLIKQNELSTEKPKATVQIKENNKEYSINDKTGTLIHQDRLKKTNLEENLNKSNDLDNEYLDETLEHPERLATS